MGIFRKNSLFQVSLSIKQKQYDILLEKREINPVGPFIFIFWSKQQNYNNIDLNKVYVMKYCVNRFFFKPIPQV